MLQSGELGESDSILLVLLLETYMVDYNYRPRTVPRGMWQLSCSTMNILWTVANFLWSRTWPSFKFIYNVLDSRLYVVMVTFNESRLHLVVLTFKASRLFLVVLTFKTSRLYLVVLTFKASRLYRVVLIFKASNVTTKKQNATNTFPTLSYSFICAVECSIIAPICFWNKEVHTPIFNDAHAQVCVHCPWRYFKPVYRKRSGCPEVWMQEHVSLCSDIFICQDNLLVHIDWMVWTSEVCTKWE